MISDRISSLVRDIYRENLAEIFAKIEKKIKAYSDVT